MSAHAKHLREGFSLVEIMIGLTIMALLMGAIGTNVVGYLKKAKQKTTRFNLVAVQKAIEEFHMETNKYPEKLRDLIKKPSGDIKGWEGPYLKKEEAPADAWGEPLKYQRGAEGSKRPYELSSYGPNGRGAPKEEWISVWDL